MIVWVYGEALNVYRQVCVSGECRNKKCGIEFLINEVQFGKAVHVLEVSVYFDVDNHTIQSLLRANRHNMLSQSKQLSPKICIQRYTIYLNAENHKEQI